MLFPIPTPKDVEEGLCDVESEKWVKLPPKERHPKAVRAEIAKLLGVKIEDDE